MDPIRSRFLLAFGLVAVLHLVLNGADASPADSISKCLLAPLLAAWVLEQRGPRLLVAALGFCFLGDLLLELDDLFVVGMAAFAAAHVCFITYFVQRGAADALRRRPVIAAVYVLAAIVVVAWAWGGLEPGLQPIVPIYAALLVGTASTSLAADVRCGVGGGLFLLSDGLIALGEAGRIDPDSVGVGLAIMALYVAAILLLTAGILQRQRRPTDCWPRLPDRSTNR